MLGNVCFAAHSLSLFPLQSTRRLLSRLWPLHILLEEESAVQISHSLHHTGADRGSPEELEDSQDWFGYEVQSVCRTEQYRARVEIKEMKTSELHFLLLFLFFDFITSFVIIFVVVILF